ncbi:hypothetical protein PBI_SPORTO_67 [Arthrobacter phage Sporto]|nr:hypothetical protein PBI_SPORTO_67 [Arthrobacter phage Sporto]
MGTYRSKEIVDARQFDGSIEKAQELVAWIKAHKPDYRRSELNISKGISMLGSADPVIEVPVPCLNVDFGEEPKDWWSLSLKPTDWLVLEQDGRFTIYFDEGFKKKFVQV